MNANASGWHRVQELFHAAAALPAHERTSFLERECRDDAELLAELCTLLRNVSATGGLLDRPEQLAQYFLDHCGPSFSIGQHVGRYRLRRFLSAGGMGTVFEAEQEEPHRIVALKLMRESVASADARQRFRREAEILAQLNHPAIAQVFEAGVHHLPMSDDREALVPYFAMELVIGALPITAFARTRQLDRRARVELLACVCGAIHHGHQNAILHRDLKPANILVGERGDPKVIDFGIARSLEAGPGSTTLSGALVGTVAYMSPEQCDPSRGLLDVRSDVYSLGVVAYELLLQRPPYAVPDQSPLRAAAIICEQAPERPCSVDRSIGADLEAILLKALAKDPEERYASASELARDLHSWLADEPVTARAPTFLRQVRRLARRHRLAAVASLALVALLVLATTITSVALVRAVRAERTSRERELAIALAATELRQESERSEATLGFLEQTLGATRPRRLGVDVRFADVLEDAAIRLRVESIADPLLQAQIQSFLAKSYMNVMQFERCLEHGRAALDVMRETHGPDDERVLDLALVVAEALGATFRYDEAYQICQDLLGRWQSKPDVPPGRLAGVLQQIGRLYLGSSDLSTAEPFLLRANELLRGRESEEPWMVCEALNALALLRWGRGELVEFRSLTKRADEVARAHLPDSDPMAIYCRARMAHAFLLEWPADEAERRLIECVAELRGSFGERDPRTQVTQLDLARLYMEKNRLAEAEQIYREVLDKRRPPSGEQTRDTRQAMSFLGDCLRRQGRKTEARTYLQSAFESARDDDGWENPNTSLIAKLLVALLLEESEWSSVEEIVEEALAETVPKEKIDEVSLLFLRARRVDAWRGQGRIEEARAELESMAAACADNPTLQRWHAEVLTQLGKLDHGAAGTSVR